MDFYNHPVYPTTIFDGTDRVFEPNPAAYLTTYYDHIMAAKADTPHFNLELTATATSNAGNVELRIVTADTIPGEQILAYIAVCQDSVAGAYKDFNYVCQQLYDFPVNLVYPDSLDTTIVFSHALPVEKMRAVVFVQSIDTKKIMHSITRQFEEVK